MSNLLRVSSDKTDARPEGAFPFHKTHIHRQTRARAQAAPPAFWPAVTLLLSVAVSLICWGLYNALPQMAAAGEKHLRQTPFSSKFNPTSVEAPPAKPPEQCPELEFEHGPLLARATAEPPLAALPSNPPLASPPVMSPPVASAPLPRPPVAPEPPLTLPKVDGPFVLAPALPPLPPALPVPPPVEVLPAKLTPLEAPVVQVPDSNPLVYRESTSGDTPMLRNWKSLALVSLMTATVSVQVPAPAVAGDKDNKALLERLDTLQETIKKSFEGVSAEIGGIKTDLKGQKGDLKTIRDDIDVLKDDGLKQRLDMANANGKIKQIETALDKIRSDLEALRIRESVPSKPAIDKASVDEIKIKLGGIEQAILKLLPSTNRIAMSPPSSSARVVLVNLYPEELLFLVNQRPYRVAPGANVPAEVPAGTLNYEVISGTWGQRAKNTTTLAPNETFTLTAR